MRSRILYLVLITALTVNAQTTKKAKPPASHGSPAASEPVAILHTTAGDMKCQLLPDKAPITVKNFIGLATGKKDWTDPATNKVVHGRPLYDGVIFHRVIPEFMIQAGDPLGTGYGGPGFKFQDELRADLKFDQPGRLAMANSGPNTNGSQFFITEAPLPGLDPCFDPGGCVRGSRVMRQNTGYTIFGQCDSNTVELVKKIARSTCGGGMPCDPQNSHPANPVKITHIEIQNEGKSTSPKKPSGSTKKSTGKAAPTQ